MMLYYNMDFNDIPGQRDIIRPFMYKHMIVQLTDQVEVTPRYFFDWAMLFFQWFYSHVKSFKPIQTSNAEFIRLDT